MHLFIYFETQFHYVSLAGPETHYVGQAVLKFTTIHLPLLGIKVVHPHVWPLIHFKYCIFHTVQVYNSEFPAQPEATGHLFSVSLTLPFLDV